MMDIQLKPGMTWKQQIIYIRILKGKCRRSETCYRGEYDCACTILAKYPNILDEVRHKENYGYCSMKCL